MGADGAGSEVAGVQTDGRHVACVGAGAVQQRDARKNGVACRDRDGNSVAMPEPVLGQDGLVRAATSLSVLGLQFMRQVAEFVGAGAMCRQPFTTVVSVRASQAGTDAAGSTSHPARSQHRVAALACGGGRD